MKASRLLYSNNNKCIFCGRNLFSIKMTGSVTDSHCYQSDHYFNNVDSYLEIYLDNYRISINFNHLEVYKSEVLVHLEDLSLKDDFESVNNLIDFMYKKVKVIADNLIFI